MPDKQSSPPAGSTIPTAKDHKGVPQAHSAATTHNSYFDPADIPRTHELIVDAVTEILTHGGHPNDVERLLRATMAHTRRRTFATIAPEQEVADLVALFIKDDFDKWKHDLIAAWAKTKRGERPAIDPQTITDRVRVNARESLWLQFDNFTRTASPEEIRFLLEVLHNWESRSIPGERSGDEIFIGYAFETELHRERACYLKVPERLLDPVQDYLNTLRALDQEDDGETEGEDEGEEVTKDSEELRASRLAIVSELAGMGPVGIKEVRDFMDVMKAERGNAVTPVEDFITSLPAKWKFHATRGGLTPDKIIHIIEGQDGMRSWFDDAVGTARHFNLFHAASVAASGSDEDETA